MKSYENVYISIWYWLLILWNMISIVLLGSEWSSRGCCRFGADKFPFLCPCGWSNDLLHSTCICTMGSPLRVLHNSQICGLDKVWVSLLTSSSHIQLSVHFGLSCMKATHSTIHCPQIFHLWLNSTCFLCNDPTAVYFSFLRFSVLRLFISFVTCIYLCSLSVAIFVISYLMYMYYRLPNPRFLKFEPHISSRHGKWQIFSFHCCRDKP